MPKLSDISSSPTLREYAQGAAQAANSKIAEFIAPTVSVGTSTGYYKKYDEKHRFRIPATRRALGGRATELGFSASDETYNCKPHALDFPVDNLESIESEGLENILQEGADMTAAVAALSHEKEVVELALAAAGAGTTLAITAGDDVVDQIDKSIIDVIKAAKYGGLMGVGVLFGAGAWRVVKNHPSVRARYVSGGKSKFSVPGMEDFSQLLLSNPQVDTTFMCYDDAAEGLAEDIEFVLDGDILVFARMANPTRRDPSFMKTFRLRNQWMVPGIYHRDDGRVEVAKFDWSGDPKITNTTAVKRRTVVVA